MARLKLMNLKIFRNRLILQNKINNSAIVIQKNIKMILEKKNYKIMKQNHIKSMMIYLNKCCIRIQKWWLSRKQRKIYMTIRDIHRNKLKIIQKQN